MALPSLLCIHTVLFTTDIALPILMVTTEGVLTVTALVWYVRTAGQLTSLVSTYASAAIPILIGFYQAYGVATTSSILAAADGYPLSLVGALRPGIVRADSPDAHRGPRVPPCRLHAG